MISVCASIVSIGGKVAGSFTSCPCAPLPKRINAVEAAVISPLTKLFNAFIAALREF